MRHHGSKSNDPSIAEANTLTDTPGFWRLSHGDLAAVLSRPDLSWGAARVYIALADLIIGYGKTHDVVSLGQITEMTGIHRRHVSRSLTQLESLGLCGKEMLGPQKAKRWVVWPCPSIPEAGSTPEVGTVPKTVPEVGSKDVPKAGSKSVPKAGNHQEERNKIPRKQLRDCFEQARKAYPGTVRGLDDEFKVFLSACKKRKLKPDETVGLLLPAINLQVNWRAQARPGEFRPHWKNFTTWLNKACWGEEMPDAHAPTSTPMPAGPNPRQEALKGHPHINATR